MRAIDRNIGGPASKFSTRAFPNADGTLAERRRTFQMCYDTSGKGKGVGCRFPTPDPLRLLSSQRKEPHEILALRRRETLDRQQDFVDGLADRHQIADHEDT